MPIKKHLLASNEKMSKHRRLIVRLSYERSISFSVRKQRVQKVLLHEEGHVFYSGQL